MSSTQLKCGMSLRRVLHWLGGGLALAGVLFVGFRLHSYGLALDFSKVARSGWYVIAGLAIVYGSANLLLAQAWWLLLGHFSADTPRFGAVKLYGMSQLAKYVPGNIFHLAGRQALGMAAGIATTALAKSMVYELGLIAVAGALSGWLILPRLLPGFPFTAGIVLALISGATLVALLRRLGGKRMALAFLMQVMFLLVSGAIFVALLELIGGTETLSAWSWLTIGSAYIFAWLVGLVTPGAPAGVGVREFILLFFLNEMVTDESLLMAVLLGRLVTVAGDLYFFTAAAFIPQKCCATESEHV